MPGPEQKIKTVLIPEIGLDLSPQFVQQSVVSPDFIRSFSYLIGKSENRGVLIRATSDGSLYVVSTGVPFELYIVFSGTTTNDYAAPNIKEYDVAYSVTDLLIEDNPAVISFRNSQGTWLADKSLPVGYHSIDFIHYGLKIKSRNTDSPSTYEVTIYR